MKPGAGIVDRPSLAVAAQVADTGWASTGARSTRLPLTQTEGMQKGAQATVLPQPHGPGGHLADTQEGPDGDGLHPGVRRRRQRRTCGSRHLDRSAPKKCRKLGVRTEKAELRSLDKQVRATGRVEIDEQRSFAITPKFEGYVERLHVNITGQPVAKGQALFDVYSPELVSAQREYAIAAEGVAALEEMPVAKRRAGMKQLAESPCAPQQLGHLRRADPRTWPGPGPRDARWLPLPGFRRRHRKESPARHALHAGRKPLPDGRPVVACGLSPTCRTGHRSCAYRAPPQRCASMPTRTRCSRAA
jgi:hypothetical protein